MHIAVLYLPIFPDADLCKHWSCLEIEKKHAVNNPTTESFISCFIPFSPVYNACKQKPLIMLQVQTLKSYKMTIYSAVISYFSSSQAAPCLDNSSDLKSAAFPLVLHWKCRLRTGCMARDPADSWAHILHWKKVVAESRQWQLLVKELICPSILPFWPRLEYLK